MAPASLETIRVEALFVSDVRYPDALTSAVVHNAVLGSLRRYGAKGCAAMVAAEFERHPEEAEPRMSWVRGAIRTIYPSSPPTPPRPRPPSSPSPIAA